MKTELGLSFAVPCRPDFAASCLGYVTKSKHFSHSSFRSSTKSFMGSIQGNLQPGCFNFGTHPCRYAGVLVAAESRDIAEGRELLEASCCAFLTVSQKYGLRNLGRHRRRPPK